MRCRSAVVILAFILLATLAFADTMTFEGLRPNTYITSGSYLENGIKLSPVGTLWIAGPGSASTCGAGGCLDNGTNVGVVYVSTGLIIDTGGVFTLNGFDYGYSFANTGGATALQITGFLNNTAEYTAMLPLDSTLGFQTAVLNWTGVDRVRLAASGGTANYFSFDNITVNESAVQPVPEPATLTLAATGLLALGTKLRKRARK